MDDTSSVEAPEPIELHVAINLDEAMAVGIRRLREGRLEGAEAVYRAVLALAPECADALHFLGVLQYQRGQHEAAIELIRRAIMAAPGYTDAHNNLGNIYKEQGDLEKARQAYLQVIEINPECTTTFPACGSPPARRHDGRC